MPDPVNGWDLEEVLDYVAGLIGVTKDDLEYKDVAKGYKKLEDVKGEKTVRIYIHVPLFEVVGFGNNLQLIRGDWVYGVDEIDQIAGGAWDPTDGVKIKLIERK